VGADDVDFRLIGAGRECSREARVSPGLAVGIRKIGTSLVECVCMGGLSCSECDELWLSGEFPRGFKDGLEGAVDVALRVGFDALSIRDGDSRRCVGSKCVGSGNNWSWLTFFLLILKNVVVADSLGRVVVAAAYNGSSDVELPENLCTGKANDDRDFSVVVLDMVRSLSASERRGEDSLNIRSLIDFLGLEGVLLVGVG